METKVKIEVGDKLTLDLGGPEFVVLRREVGDEGGTSIEIFSDISGDHTRVLRFDCFRVDPHYHMPPSAPGQLQIVRASVGDPLEWALACTRDRLPEMIRRAGYAD